MLSISVREFSITILGLASFLLTSCAPSSKRLNKLELGMTRSDAMKVVGKPVSTTAGAGGEVLAYDFTDKPFGDGMIFPGRYFVFLRNGRVTGWQRDDEKDALDRQRAFQMNTAGIHGSASARSEVSGGIESVILVRLIGSADKVIVQRRNGTRHLLDIGIGALSLSQYEGREILVNSPSLFAGVGSSIILPRNGQTARIWSSTQI